MNLPDHLMSRRAASRLLNVSEVTIDNWVRKGKLKRYRLKLNNRPVFRHNEVEALRDSLCDIRPDTD